MIGRATRNSRTTLILAVLLAVGCTPLRGQISPLPHNETFDVEAAFLGRTEDVGSLKIMFAPRRSMHVRGQGWLEDDGTLVLQQLVEQAGKRSVLRIWRINEVAPGHYAGTLTDAAGPVLLDIRGDRLQIRYTLKSGGTTAEQWLTKQADGSIANHMTFKRLGVRVATLSETIRRID